MNKKFSFLKFLCCFILVTRSLNSDAQPDERLVWSRDGNGFYFSEGGALNLINLAEASNEVVLTPEQLTPTGEKAPLEIKSFIFSSDFKKLMIYTNSKKVWRFETRGDYWVYDFSKSSLSKLGKSLPASSLMFAKFSPDATRAAYVCGHNIYAEDLSTHIIQPLTRNGSRKLINGTFDWVYEEEFFCRDGFRWSPDGKAIAFWQINDSSTRDYYMLNTTDSVYSRVIPVEYPVTGQMPSPFKIGVVQVKEKITGKAQWNRNDEIGWGKVRWMEIPNDPRYGNYLPRMDWAANSEELIVQRLNRSQNESDILICNASTGEVRLIYHEKDKAWIDFVPMFDIDFKMGEWDWLNKGTEFLWQSDKDGWNHVYRIRRDGKKAMLVTPGNYDVIRISLIDEKNNLLYFIASPENATEEYLYRCPLDGTGRAERVTPANYNGTNKYELSPNGKFAGHHFSNYYTPDAFEWISMPEHQSLNGFKPMKEISRADSIASNISFFTIKTAEGVTMDGWMQKPIPFDPAKKYPVLFYVYTEPGEATVKNAYGVTSTILPTDWLAKDGYIYISVDNRGTPAPKGAVWRKAIYRKIGQLNISDQAQAATEILKWPFIDTSRIAVWGWSSGGSATLNLLFQYPEIYKTGIAVAALTDMETYDNVYQERYMGNPLETKADYEKGSPLSYVSGLRGNLLFIHGSGDDNVHFNNAEKLLNELIRQDKTFQFMEYPNRTHNIDEGAGTSEHLLHLIKNYLREHCPGGGK
jgi:dipeptidyl-peptidase 4